MRTTAVILKGARDLGLEPLALVAPGADDLVVEVAYSGISTGTEKLFWSGTMPPFPGMGYPLVPGYEAAGEVVEAGANTGFRVGERVFVPGANCFAGNVKGLFGGASRHLVSKASRVARIDSAMGATALPDLIVGHGTLGRLLARLTLAAGAPAPTVWDTNPARHTGAVGYEVIAPEDDTRRDYRAIYDASGAKGLIDQLVMRLAKGGEIVLAGFYTEPVAFAFPPAFMKEARIRIAAEWAPEDLTATRALIECGALSLSGLITHTRPAADAALAYETAFTDAGCLKMILDWSGHA
ncbi:MAG: chlorophyll synthesis pathway protein BchC [Rhodobacterales bacterium 12-65-15]|nr:MAG: chlorophyll synthesis pathway protein BchC [Rhodobacterales bacterium 12-65-15]